ncbi:hypothetical protein CROQUDRAFT_669245 [Cronartium quercuum f. sp. fusiforme G11]|uniref:Uncharacterized protein n=1 Tax=Cronartium quercuum f. sp. fusiforme G11 TaxID=708437 RepID=A0A9P6TEH6_9BASI|nr:hypothetical protein CROQUDRAFT_669245 [Cronartium quercuum f. sp. fusiforme G11]
MSVAQSLPPLSDRSSACSAPTLRTPALQTVFSPEHRLSPSIKTGIMPSNLNPPAHSSTPSQPAPTLTEKVDESTTGWEMWVADENLMNELGGRSHPELPPSLAQPQSNSNLPMRSISSHSHSLRQPQPSTASRLRPPSQTTWKTDSKPRSKAQPSFTLTPLTQQTQKHPKSDPAPSSANPRLPDHKLTPGIAVPNSIHRTFSDPLPAFNEPVSPKSFFPRPITASSPPQQEQPANGRPSSGMSATKVYSSAQVKPESPMSKDLQPDPSPALLTSSVPTHSPRATLATEGTPYTHAYELYDRRVSRVAPVGWSANNAPPLQSPLPPPAPAPAEVCVECMMRDRDMADVDVVGPGVWARRSDADFQEAVAAEARLDERDELESVQSKKAGSTTGPWASTSREGSGYDSTSSGAHRGQRRRRIGHGSPLTQSALKAWTQMNPPAASHRWRTLQLYLKEQRHYLELEYKAKLTTQLEHERAEQALRNSMETLGRPVEKARSEYGFLNSVPSRGRRHSNRQSTVLPSGMVLETVDVSKDEKEAARYRSSEQKSRPSMSIRRTSGTSITKAGYVQSPVSPSHPSLASMSTDMLANPAYLSANPPRSPSTRPPSPSRFSVASRRSGFAENFRPFSPWSRNNRRSISHSVLSFAPSGSMLEMHVGLSQDRQHHQRMQENESPLPLATPVREPDKGADDSGPVGKIKPEYRRNKTLKKGLRGIFVKLGLATSRRSPPSVLDRPPPLSAPALNVPDDEPLAPPPPLSLLAREQHYPRRTPSALSLPLTPRSPSARHHFSNTPVPDDDTLAEELAVGTGGGRRRSRSGSQLDDHLGGGGGSHQRNLSNWRPQSVIDEEGAQPTDNGSIHKPASIRSVVSRSLSYLPHRYRPTSLIEKSHTSNSIINNDHKDNYFPHPRSRKSISRSSDFLALRYLSSSTSSKPTLD